MTISTVALPLPPLTVCVHPHRPIGGRGQVRDAAAAARARLPLRLCQRLRGGLARLPRRLAGPLVLHVRHHCRAAAKPNPRRSLAP